MTGSYPFFVGGRGHGKTKRMREVVAGAGDVVGERGPNYPWAYYDELRPIDSNPIHRAVANALATGGEVVVGVDGDAAVVMEKRTDGRFHIVGDESGGAMDWVQQMVTELLAKQRARDEAFLKAILHATDDEVEGVRRLDPEIQERLVRRMDEEPLPVNFWQTVNAHRMLEDEVGRRLVADIIARKVGCDGERSSD
jgi:hypothetical protein